MYFTDRSKGVHHATIISKVDDNMIYYSAHTSSCLEKPLSEGLKDDFVQIIRMKDSN